MSGFHTQKCPNPAVQVQLDYADLSERLDWALTHDAEAHAIAEQAAVVARLNLRIEDVECYWCAHAAGMRAGCCHRCCIVCPPRLHQIDTQWLLPWVSGCAWVRFGGAMPLQELQAWHARSVPTPAHSVALAH
jgi:hypothetical protein